MKLCAELVPKTVWNKSLAKLLPRSVWNNIREDHIKKSGRKCEVCGESNSTMNLHEIWSYDDLNHIQKLDGFILLCTWCHHIKHIGLAGILANENKLNYNELVNHFCKVNACSVNDFKLHIEDAFATWRKRSLYSWKQDFGEYGKYTKA